MKENQRTNKQRRKHNKNLSDSSIGSLLAMIKYKSAWYSRECIEVGKYYASSKLCSNCGYKMDDMNTNIRTWTCPKCGSEHDRDINAAINIRKEGIRLKNISA